MKFPFFTVQYIIKLFLISLMTTRCENVKPNFLFIIVDDLKPALGCYGDKNAHTPNIDFMARESILFTKTFAQQSLCAPSRNSLLTGRRPDSLQLYDFYNYWRDRVGNFTTLPQHLKNNDYTTMSIGKVFHPGKSSNGSDDNPYSWSSEPFHPYTNIYKDASDCPTSENLPPAKNLVCPVSVPLMPNKTLPDIENLKAAKTFLQSRTDETSPFFLAIGFQKPHIPFKYPEEYLAFHPISKFSVPSYYSWTNRSHIAYNPWNDLRKRDDVAALNLNFPWEKIPDNFARKIIQSYYASVTYVDAIIGELVQYLMTLGLRKSTIIILTSDHGWSLGEHAEWAKYSNFDVTLRVPLLIHIPELFRANSEDSVISCKVDEIVELVDLFPTIAELAGVSIETCPIEERQDVNPCSEGLSLIPLIKASRKSKIIPWKRAAFSQYPRPGIEPTLKPNSDEPLLKEIRIMGYSIRTQHFRYTSWFPFSHVEMKTDWGTLLADELYDHRIDPDEYFNKVRSIKYIKIKEMLKKKLRNGWRNAMLNYLESKKL